MCVFSVKQVPSYGTDLQGACVSVCCTHTEAAVVQCAVGSKPTINGDDL